jgi:hypothetical protein
MLKYSLALIAGYAGSKWITPKCPSLKTKSLHIHHWIWGSIILISFLILDWNNDVSNGLLTGIVLQGLSYKNWSIFKK